MKKIAIVMILFSFLFTGLFSKEKTEVFLQIGHSAKISGVAITSDNKFIISSSNDKTIKIWSTESNTLTKTLTGHLGSIECIALSPDDKIIASADTDKTIKVWNFKKELFSIKSSGYNINSLIFTKDSRFLISCGSNDMETHIWDLKEQKEVAKINNNYSFKGVNLSTDGNFLLLMGANPVIIDMNDYKKITKMDLDSNYYLSFSSDGKFIVSAGQEINILNSFTGKIIKKISKDSALKAIFSNDGKRIYSIDYSNDIKIWDVEKASLFTVLKSHTDQITDIALSNDGKYIVSSSKDNSIKLWDINKNLLVNTYKSRSNAVNSIAVSNDGKFAVSGGEDKIMRVWDFTDAKLSYSFTRSNDVIGSVAISQDQKYIAMTDQNVRYFDISKIDKAKKFTSEKFYNGIPVLFSNNGKYILSCLRNNDIYLSDIESDKIIRKYSGHTEQIRSIAFSPDNKYFVSGGNDRTVRLWNIAINANEQSVMSDHTDDVTAVAFSPDGNFIASGSTDGTLIISEVDYDMSFLRPVKKIKTHKISSMIYSRNGEKLIAGSYDKSIVIIDVKTGIETDVLAGHLSTVRTLSLTKDGKFLLSGGFDSTVKIWNMETKKEIAMLAGFTDGEWVIITPEGYFNASKNGAGYLGVKIGSNYYTMDNYMETFYRPDLVKLALAGINLKGFSKLDDVELAPNVSIQKCDVKNDEVNVTLKITDNGGGIGDIRIYMNESAIILENGRNIRSGNNSGVIIKDFKVKLQNGENIIKATAFNSNNSMQSNQSLKEIDFKSGVERKPSLYAVIVGINEYENPNLELQFAVPDAKLIAETLKLITKALFDKVEIKLLTKKEETTKDFIMKTLLSYKSINPEDLFVFYDASHGTVSDGEYFLITSNVGSTSTKKLQEDALSQNFIKELISNIPSSKKLIILDTCNSQALGDNIQVALMSRGLTEDTAVKVLSRAVGVTILCAAKSNQEALEGYKDHGLFTFVIAEGLSGKADTDGDGYVKTFELADYVDNEVPRLAQEIFNFIQYPIVSPGGQGFPIGKVK